MKNLLTFSIIALLLSSCGYSTPSLNDEKNPFIVNEILPYNETHAKYVSLPQETSTATFETPFTAIIAPKRKYNIGDTIKLN